MPVVRSYKIAPCRCRACQLDDPFGRALEQQAQFQNAVPQGYEQQLAAPGIVAGGCTEQDWYPRQDNPPGAQSPVSEFVQWLANASEQEYWAMRRGGTFISREGRLCRTDGEKRALALLRRHLNEDQWECLTQHRYFWITGYMRHYGRMREHLFQITPYGVFEVKDGGRRSFCIVTMEPGMPEADWMLCVKLLIESNLKKFFATAKTRGWQTMACNQMG